MSERCGQSAGHFIAREGSYFPCALVIGHVGQHRAGGNCIAHGNYISDEPGPPKCPACLLDNYALAINLSAQQHLNFYVNSEVKPTKWVRGYWSYRFIPLEEYEGQLIPGERPPK